LYGSLIAAEGDLATTRRYTEVRLASQEPPSSGSAKRAEELGEQSFRPVAQGSFCEGGGGSLSDLRLKRSQHRYEGPAPRMGFLPSSDTFGSIR